MYAKCMQQKCVHVCMGGGQGRAEEGRERDIIFFIRNTTPDNKSCQKCYWKVLSTTPIPSIDIYLQTKLLGGG